VIFEGSWTYLREEQLEKLSLPNLETEKGILIELRDLQEKKHSF
jgi:hypothetical protein